LAIDDEGALSGGAGSLIHRRHIREADGKKHNRYGEGDPYSPHVHSVTSSLLTGFPVSSRLNRIELFGFFVIDNGDKGQHTGYSSPNGNRGFVRHHSLESLMPIDITMCTSRHLTKDSEPMIEQNPKIP
jgi:hypothetical protein